MTDEISEDSILDFTIVMITFTHILYNMIIRMIMPCISWPIDLAHVK